MYTGCWHRAPRSPALHMHRGLQDPPGQTRKRARSRSPRHGRRSARRLVALPEHFRPRQTQGDDHGSLQPANESPAPRSSFPAAPAEHAPCAAHVYSAAHRQAAQDVQQATPDQQPERAAAQPGTALHLPLLRDLLTEMSLLNELPLPRACSQYSMLPEGKFASLHAECWDQSEPPSTSPSAQHSTPHGLVMTPFAWHDYDIVSQPPSSAASVIGMDQDPPQLRQHAASGTCRPPAETFEPPAEGPCQWDFITPFNMRAYGIVDLLSEGHPKASNATSPTSSAACSSSEH